MVSRSTLLSVTISPRETIRAAAQRIQDAEIKFLVVCDENGRLLGTVTDGDIRRGVSTGQNFEGTVDLIMNRSPKVADAQERVEVLRMRMRNSVVRHMPRVDKEGRVFDVVLLDSVVNIVQRDASVLLMAGGRGSRLMPLTADTPKPLLKVGNKPVIERQIERLIGFGFKRFFISVNYLGHMIEDHFGDGSRLGVEIVYLREQQPLGTAGALGLLPRQQAPVVVMNGDIITKTDIGNMLDLFLAENVAASVGVREHHYTVPYGCVSVDGQQIVALEEKPTFRHLINSGIYVLASDILSEVRADAALDMPDLIQNLIASGRRANSYVITEEWIDIGRKEDLEWAHKLLMLEDRLD